MKNHMLGKVLETEQNNFFRMRKLKTKNGQAFGHDNVSLTELRWISWSDKQSTLENRRVSGHWNHPLGDVPRRCCSWQVYVAQFIGLDNGKANQLDLKLRRWTSMKYDDWYSMVFPWDSTKFTAKSAWAKSSQRPLRRQRSMAKSKLWYDGLVPVVFSFGNQTWILKK